MAKNKEHLVKSYEIKYTIQEAFDFRNKVVSKILKLKVEIKVMW